MNNGYEDRKQTQEYEHEEKWFIRQLKYFESKNMRLHRKMNDKTETSHRFWTVFIPFYYAILKWYNLFAGGTAIEQD